MTTISIRELIDLAESDISEGEKKIEKIFDWKIANEQTLIKWSLGIPASLILAILAAYFRANWSDNPADFDNTTKIILIVSFVLALISASFAFHRIFQARKVKTEYIASISLYSKLLKIQEFIRLYRQNTNG